MTKKIAALLCWVLAAGALVMFFTRQQVTESEETNNNGRRKLELAAGETAAWEWVPSFETDSLRLWVSGRKNAESLVLRLTASRGETEVASAEWRAGEAEDDYPELKGSFQPGKGYTLRAEASGEGSLRLRGLPDEQGAFMPWLQAKGRTVRRSPLWLFLGLVTALLPLMPLPEGRREPPLPEKKEGNISKKGLDTGNED